MRFGRVFVPATLGVTLGVLLFRGSSALGAAGDIAIYRAASADEAITTASFDHTWDTTHREDSATYELDTNNVSVKCKAGHHLVLYSARFDSTSGANRSEVQSQIRLAGANQPIGWSQGYIRRANNDDELITAGGGIVEVAGDDDVVSLRSFRTDSNGAGVKRFSNASAIQLVKLDDAWDYCRLSRTNNATGPGTSFGAVAYNRQDELDAGSFAHTNGSADITLKAAGHYLVLANTYLRHTGGSRRCGFVQRLTLDGTQIAGSRTTVYMRGNSESCLDGAATAAMIIETTSANQVLKVQCMKEDGQAAANIIGARTAVTIAKLPDTAEYIRLDDSGTDDFNPGTTTALGWDTELEYDHCFTHNDSRIGVTEDDDYLFFCTLYDNDDDNERVQWWQRWRKNGSTIYPYGTTGRYSRNANDNGGTNHKNGNRSAIVVDLVAGDYIESVSEQLGNSGTLSANVKGVQGVRLSSVFDPPDPNGPMVENARSGATGVVDTSAVMPGDLISTGTSATTLWVYYGTNDGGEVAGNWDTNACFDAGLDAGPHSTNVTGLTPNTVYYYRFAASNATTNAWARYVKSFKTLGPPTVTHDGGAYARVAGVTMSGELTDGTGADATIYWGRTDGGTNHNAWEHTNTLGQVNVGWFGVGESWAQSLTGVDITNETPALAGSEVRQFDAWTVTGGGNDIGNTNDCCRFAYTQLTGDFDVYCRASDFTGGSDGWRKGGLMARESLDGTSRNAFIGRTPASGQKRITFQYRETDAGITPSTTANGFTASHYWLRLIRVGDTFSGYRAPDAGGTPGAWSQMGLSRTVDMSDGVYVGLAVTARNAGQLTSCTFDRLGGITSGVDELLYGIEHHYRVYATNTYGADWSDATESFHTVAPDWTGIACDPATDLTPDSATLNGSFNGTGAVFDVFVYWGTSDGGTNASAWGRTNLVAAYTNVGRTALAYAATGLVSGTEYFYTFSATNVATNMWAAGPSASFTAVIAPTIDNSTGAVVRMADATLRGELSTGGAGDVTVYWGTSDGGTNHGTWQYTNTLGELLQGPFETDAGEVVLYGLTYYYRCYVTNAMGEDWSGVEEFESLAPRGHSVEAGTVSAGGTWTRVELDRDYDSPVVVCTVTYASNTVPAVAVARVRNVERDSFEVKLQNPGDQVPLVADTIHYLVMDEGTNRLPDGRSIEAHRVVSDGVNNKTENWNANQLEKITYGHTYSNPVVLGQVMTANDSRWSSFWSSDGAGGPPDGTNCYVGKHVGEDPDAVRADETLGVIVVEAGTGEIGGVPYEAGVGPKLIQSVGEAPPYSYALTAFSAAPEVGVACQVDMDGADGCWVGLYGAAPLTATSMDLVVIEDEVGDADRGHVAEKAAYWVFGSAVASGNDLFVTNLPPTAVSSNSATFHAELRGAGSAFDVTLYWGTSDGGTNAGAWAYTNVIGSYADEPARAIGFAATGLTDRTEYHYAFTASNQHEVLWGTPSVTFTTLDDPEVDNGTGAQVVEGSATLSGELLAGGLADVTVYWGLFDGGTNASAWQQANPLGELLNGAFATDTTSNLLYGAVYYYRCYATNAYGEDWADSTARFAAWSPADPGVPVTDGLALWLDGSDIDGQGDGTTGDPTDGENVAVWYDKSGNGNNAGTSTNYPTVADGMVNGRPVVQFASAAHFLTFDSPVVAQGSTAFVIYRRTSGDGWANPINSRNQGGNGWLHMMRGNHPGERVLMKGSGNQNLFSGVSAATWNIQAVQLVSGDYRLWVDGALTGPSASTQTFTPFTDVGNIIGDFAEVLIYDDVLTGQEHDQVGGYLAWKHDIASSYPAYVSPDGIGIANLSATGLMTNAAALNATLAGTGWVFDVWVHWGTNDGARVAADWDHSEFVGFYTNYQGAIGHTVSGLVSDTDCFYTFQATNTARDLWAAPSVPFTPLGTLVVSNLAVGTLTVDTAELRAELIDGGAGDITFYCGRTDAGMNHAGWEYTDSLGPQYPGTYATSVSGLVAGAAYYYRAYATNAASEAWGDPATCFTATPAVVSIDDVVVTEGDVGSVGAVFTVTASPTNRVAVSVNYATVAGSAVEGSDYVGAAGTLLIPPGVTSSQITVLVSGDTEYEYPPETFSVQLDNPTNCTTGDAVGAGTILDNDLPKLLTAWECRMKITFDGYAGDETLTNFPALVRFSEAGIPGFAYHSFTSDAGHDLRFVDAGRSRWLNYEIDTWNTNGESCVWVQLPELPSGGTHAWAVWGNDALLNAGTVGGATDLAGCVLWLKADEGVVTNGTNVTSWLDRSGQGHDVSQAVVTNQPLLATNVVGGKPVVRFDANDRHLIRADALGFTGNAAVTVFMVIEADDVTSIRRALHLGNAAGKEQETIGFAADSSFRYNNGNRVFTNAPLTGGIGIGTWVAEAGGSYGEGRFFKNGVEQAQTEATNPGFLKNLVDGETLIGQGRSKTGGRSDPFLGDIAEIVVYDRALNANERESVGHYLEQKYGLDTDYAGQDPYVTPPLYTRDGSTWSQGYAGVYHMGLSGTGVEDSAPGDYDGTGQGDPVETAGAIGKALDFDGNDWVSLPNLGFSGDQSVAFEAWIDLHNIGNDGILAFGLGQNNRACNIRTKGNTLFRYYFWNNDIDGDAGEDFTDKPVHIVATYDAATSERWIYYNGGEIGYQDNVANPNFANQDYRIARSTADEYPEGWIDEARISRVSRSADWVEACHENQKPNSTFARYTDVHVPSGMLLIVR